MPSIVRWPVSVSDIAFQKRPERCISVTKGRGQTWKISVSACEATTSGSSSRSTVRW